MKRPSRPSLQSHEQWLIKLDAEVRIFKLQMRFLIACVFGAISYCAWNTNMQLMIYERIGSLTASLTALSLK